jgi:hypothetical protein
LPALDRGPVEWLALDRLALILRSDEAGIGATPGDRGHVPTKKDH